MPSALIVANAPWRWEEWAVRLVREAEVVLAADGGANHLARLGVRPHAVVGDLDSVDTAVRRWIGEDRVVPRPDQDFTDLHKALAYAFDECGATRVTILAATGGRLDHALDNLGQLVRWSPRGEVEIAEPGCRIVAVAGRRELETTPGQLLSIVPWGHCEAVTTTGLRWALRGEPFDLAERTGVSNRADGERATVEVRGGALLLFRFHPGW
jgi:thiamine pyrophosphokinase